MNNEETKKKFDEAVSLYNDERYDEALPLFEALAEQEHTGARYYLISHYRDWAQKTKPATRLEWLLKAAEQGIAAAQCDLGACYMVGSVIKADYQKAAELFRKAADQGYKKAYAELAFCYEKGAGVPQDYAQAAEWYQKAAEQGDTFAKDCLEKLSKLQRKKNDARFLFSLCALV